MIMKSLDRLHSPEAITLKKPWLERARQWVERTRNELFLLKADAFVRRYAPQTPGNAINLPVRRGRVISLRTAEDTTVTLFMGQEFLEHDSLCTEVVFTLGRNGLATVNAVQRNIESEWGQVVDETCFSSQADPQDNTLSRQKVAHIMDAAGNYLEKAGY